MKKRNTYKYDVVGTSEAKSKAEFPQYFLGKSAKEAEDTLKAFGKYLNNLASAYAVAAPAIDKSDFFIEGVEALAKAKKDFDPNKGAKFTPYAKFLIVDAMNEYIRKNRAVVKLPANISKANKVIHRIKSLLGPKEDVWFEVMFEGAEKLPSNALEKLEHFKTVFENAAKRANLSCRELADRAEHLPTALPTEELSEHFVDVNYDEMMAKIVVDKIMPMLSETEQVIAELIMSDLNNVEIARAIGKSDTYVASVIKEIKRKALKMITGE